MSKLACILLTAACIAPASVSASTLLVVDLSTLDEITITATDGWSSATVSGNDTTGFYLDGFFGSSPTPLGHTLSTGNLTSALNNSDLTPNLFNFNSDPAGLNVFSYTNDTASDFVEDSIAFSGSATWTVSAVAHSAALAGPSSGLIYFPADHLNDLNDATELGGWARTTVVPLPAAAWLFGTALIGLIGFGKRRKAA